MNAQRVKRGKRSSLAVNRLLVSREAGRRTRAGFYVADKKGNISFASNSFAQLLRYESTSEVIGLNLADKLYENKTDRAQLLKKLEENGQVHDFPVRMVCKDDTRVVLSAQSTLIFDQNGTPIGVEGILEEVSLGSLKKKSKERRIPELESAGNSPAQGLESMMKDQLTGLYNYPYFMTCLDAEIRRVERVFHPLCLMMIDLDNFRVYNEKNGRENGDELLKKVAGLLKENIKCTEIFCRQAQDQFLVLLPETKKDEALALAKSVKDIVQNALVDSNVTCSIGMSRFIIGMSSQEFFLQANLGLYMAKEVGKNEACMYG